MKFNKAISIILVVSLVISCAKKESVKQEKVKFAFIADAHFQDIHANFNDANYKGIINPKTGNYVNIRTMQSQLTSTRLFNENYFSFLAALDDIVSRGIKYVVLPGDFSDDGQPVHVKGLRKILDDYALKHNLSFFATTGNHDPVKPFAHHGSKSDFLGENGREQIITSSVESLKKTKSGGLKPIVSAEIQKWGYKDILNEMSSFGFYPQNKYHYWETPFSIYSIDDYTFEKAKEASVLSNRLYGVDQYNKHPDASYLVEPSPGIWLLAIDANVYVPKVDMLSRNSKDFSSASIGYNNVLLQKTHLIDWVKKTVIKAKQNNKILIAFSHYPMIDFYDDAAEEMKRFFGQKKMQLHRIPKEKVAETFADAGIQIHFGGHMHINDTGVRTTAKGNTLFNIQSPSLAAYIPAYKILTIQNDKEFEIETVVLDSVTNFDNLFPLYEQEYKYLAETKSSLKWNKDILKAENYKNFTEWHLKELVRLRFLPKDWPVGFYEKTLDLTGRELLLMNTSNKYKMDKLLKSENLSLKDFESWKGFDMVFDFYKLRGADELALPGIGLKRLKQYDIICDAFMKSDNHFFKLWGVIFKKSKEGQPSNHFKINLETNTITRIK